ncbi:MAG TPA: long-chain-fatty-acid--CoA ligase [Acidimicrobiales bacterium]|jgi:fatty-acyl-CoA synthase
MDVELNAWLLFDHAPSNAPDAEVVSRLPDGSVHRYDYRTLGGRAQQLMHALDGLGIDRGERVATLGWNSFRHLEAYFAVPCTARVLHTLNARLSPEDLAYVIGHARDRAVLVDPDFLPVLEALDGQLPGLEHIVVLGSSVPDTPLRGVIAYEDLIADQPTEYPPLDIPERTPLGLCYTSGTTGRPKGAEYTHRSTYLHAFGVTSATAIAVGPGDSVLTQVPMFHANAWGLPYGSALAGAKQVFFAGPLDPPAFVDLLLAEHVTISAAVPTVWHTLAEEIGARGGLPDMRHIVVGGSQPPRSLIARYRDQLGLRLIQAWGMTETSPLASVAWPQHRMRDWDDDAVTEAALVQAGIPIPGISISIRDDEGAPLPHDGQTMGNLYVRGPWVIDQYAEGEGPESFSADGWFRTGDVAIASPGGYFVIADRTKDLIKSGGEWISSVEMEAAIMALPAVLEAAVIAVPDPKWLERPLACVVIRDGHGLDLVELHAHLSTQGFARWQFPERLEIIDAVPKTSVGKFDKKVLRQRFAG